MTSAAASPASTRAKESGAPGSTLRWGIAVKLVRQKDRVNNMDDAVGLVNVGDRHD